MFRVFVEMRKCQPNEFPALNKSHTYVKASVEQPTLPVLTKDSYSPSVQLPVALTLKAQEL